MLRYVKAYDECSPVPSSCPPWEGGFLCGKCGWRVLLGLTFPSFCRQCGARFEYAHETERLGSRLGCAAPGRIFFGNVQEPVQSLDLPEAESTSSPEFRDRQAAHFARWLHVTTLDAGPGTYFPQDIGPTTACFDCGTIIAIGDAFYSSTRDQRALCEGCYGKAEKAGRAKWRS